MTVRSADVLAVLPPGPDGPPDGIRKRSVVTKVRGVPVRRPGTAGALLPACVDGLEGTAGSVLRVAPSRGRIDSGRRGRVGPVVGRRATRLAIATRRRP